MKELAKKEARKGNPTKMNQLKKELTKQYQKDGGKWMTVDEKKLIGQYDNKPLNIDTDLKDITQSRITLEQIRRDNAELAQKKQKSGATRKRGAYLCF